MTLPFTKRNVAYKISNAFVYPLLASLRILMGDDGKWRLRPERFLSENAEALINVLMSFYDEQCRAKPHELGRSPGSWRAVMQEARLHLAETQLAAAERT